MADLPLGEVQVRPRTLDQDEAFRRGEASPVLGEEVRLHGTDYPSLGTVHAPVGGRLALFAHLWGHITNDPFILSVVAQGFKITLNQGFPGVLRQVTNTPRDPVAQATIWTEISSLLGKKAIVQVDDFPSLCLSPIFVIPKRSGGLRVILNLKKINLYIPPQPFRMENLPVILPQLTADDWAVTIDLQDAYLHVPIHPESHRLLGFQYLNQTFLYQVLPFGLKDSPWVFTKIVATLISFFRRRGLRVFLFCYLDIWLLVAPS